MEMDLKLATLNLCLGLKCKKIEVENLTISKNIDILCLQEVEVESGFNPDPLSIKNYNFEMELNSAKARVGIYVNRNVEYTRMSHLEGLTLILS